MKKLKHLLTTIIFFIVLSSTALSHVGLDYPVGGETFQAGEVITLQWQILIDHGPSDWDLFFTSDAGSTWESIVSNLPKSQLTYDWTIPGISSNLCRIRVTQDNESATDYTDDSNDFTITTPTDVKTTLNSVEDFVLYSAYPNPFNPTTRISYSIPEASFVTLKIYDVLGNEVATLVSEIRAEGKYNVELNASGWTSGIYFYKLQAVGINSESRNVFAQTKKLILLK